jgi:excisionase family DNA binding protein
VVSGDRLLTAADVAELLAVPVSWVREATRAGQLPHVTIGRYRRYDRGDVLAWVAEQKSGGAPRRSRRHEPVASAGREA